MRSVPRFAVLGLVAAVVVSACAMYGPVIDRPEIISPPLSLVEVQGNDCPNIAGTHKFSARVIEIGKGGRKDYEGNSLEIFALLARGRETVRETMDEADLPGLQQLVVSQSEDGFETKMRHYTLPKLSTDRFVRGVDYECREGYIAFPSRSFNYGGEGPVLNHQETTRVSRSAEGNLVMYVIEGPYRRTLTESEEDFTHRYVVFDTVASPLLITF